MKLTDITTRRMAVPGNTDIHHSPEFRYPCPSETMFPHVGMLEGTPAPRYEREASVSISPPTRNVANTTIVLTTFGVMCRTMIRRFEPPATLDAETYSLVLSVSVSALTLRTLPAQLASDSSASSSGTLWPTVMAASMAMSRNGRAFHTSTSRIIISSKSPPK